MMNYRWTLAEEIGYEPKTTFWQDFSIADTFGPKAVLDTFDRAFNEWKDDIVYLTELSMVVNHKIWQHIPTGDRELGKVYDELWHKLDEWACKNLEGEDLGYYIRTLD